MATRELPDGLAPTLHQGSATPHREPTSLANLEVLVETDSHGSISAAARALGISQPSASAALRRLERRSGVDLLVRSARGSTLTPNGRAMASWAQDVLAASDRFEAAVATLRTQPSHRIQIAASMTIAEYVAPHWFTRLASNSRQRHDVELVVRNSQEVMALVDDGAAEIGFIEGHHLDRGLRARVFGTDELVVVVAPDHPWAGRRSLTVDKLLTGHLVVRERGSGTRDVLEEALKRVGSHLPSHLPYLGSTAAVKTAVRHSAAVAVVSKLAVADDLARGALVSIPVLGVDFSRELRVVWKDGVPLSAGASAVAALAMDGLPG